MYSAPQAQISRVPFLLRSWASAVPCPHPGIEPQVQCSPWAQVDRGILDSRSWLCGHSTSKPATKSKPEPPNPGTTKDQWNPEVMIPPHSHSKILHQELSATQLLVSHVIPGTNRDPVDKSPYCGEIKYRRTPRILDTKEINNPYHHCHKLLQPRPLRHPQLLLTLVTAEQPS